MQRILVALLFIAFTAPCVAQDYIPKVELGLGYSYSYARVPDSSKRVNMNGIVIAATVNANRWLGAEAEFGTHYHCISGCWIYGIRVENPDETNDSLSFLAGPKLTFARNRKVVPWIHALAGVTRTAYSNHLIDQKISTSGFGWAAGGGLDLQYGGLTVRAVQVDFTRYAAEPENFNNVRIGAGIVFHIGRRERR
ncbi:MAG: outer membrane beta-barrel protein [Acidobacteriaceae bacterium]